jgi:hypothetical protein
MAPKMMKKPALRHLIKCIFASLLILLLLGCAAQTRKSASCVYQHPAEGVITADNCIYRDESGRIIVVKDHVRNLQFDKEGLAVVRTEQDGWMYVNRKGEVVVSDVPTMDNWADDFSDGLVRVNRGAKWGFADKTGALVIPLIYDCAMGFTNGSAWVCEGCKYENVSKDEIHQMCKGGKWKRIDTTGKETQKDN